MQQPRKTLTVRVVQADSAPQSPADLAAILRRAIERKTCVAATYNRAVVQIAPHVLYSKHGDLFLDGVVVLREGKPPKEAKLGNFKLAGLTGVTATSKAFAPYSAFDAADAKYGEAVCVVQA